jgi:hypothetical protein
VEGVAERGEALRAAIEEYKEQQQARITAQKRDKDDKEFSVLTQVRPGGVPAPH